MIAHCFLKIDCTIICLYRIAPTAKFKQNQKFNNV